MSDAFHFNSGKSAKNIDELKEILKEIPEEEFNNHVNTEKNDFSNWIRHSLKDDKTADRVAEKKTLPEVISALDKPVEKAPETSKLEKPVEEKPQKKETVKEKKPIVNEKAEAEVQELMKKNKEISKSIQEDKSSLSKSPVKHENERHFSKNSLTHLLLGMGFGFILGAIVIFVLFNMGVL